MPSARSANAATAANPATARRRPRPAARPPHRVHVRPPKLRVRWERVGRIGLLLVLAIVMALYAQHALSYLHTRSQSDQQQAIVTTLQRQNAQLLRQQKSLNDPATIIRDARGLGMVRPGEQPYAVIGR